MEIILYKVGLKYNEREAIENYLRAKWQYGLDGFATNALTTHVDPFKKETVKTDTIAKSCDLTTHTVATNSDDVSCVMDRSGLENHAGQATIANRPTVNTSGINSQATLVFDGTDDISKRRWL